MSALLLSKPAATLSAAREACGATRDRFWETSCSGFLPPPTPSLEDLSDPRTLLPREAEVLGDPLPRQRLGWRCFFASLLKGLPKALFWAAWSASSSRGSRSTLAICCCIASS